MAIRIREQSFEVLQAIEIFHQQFNRFGFRVCLMCGRLFWSRNVGHRRCKACEAKISSAEAYYKAEEVRSVNSGYIPERRSRKCLEL